MILPYVSWYCIARYSDKDHLKEKEREWETRKVGEKNMERATLGERDRVREKES